MADDPTGPRRGPIPRRGKGRIARGRAPGGGRRRVRAILELSKGRRETLGVLAMLSVAALAVWLVYARSARRAEDGPTGASGRVRPASVVPARVPYRDLVRGRVREPAPGRVEILYDFEQAAVPEGRLVTHADLYPELDDWNLSPSDRRLHSGVVKGEGRLFGEARTRLAFAGPVEVEVELEIIEGAAAVRLAADRAGGGYECAIAPGGEVRLRIRRHEHDDSKGDQNKGDAKKRKGEGRLKVEDLAAPAGTGEIAAGRRCRVLFAKSEDTLRVETDGREILRAPLPSPDPFPVGNVALRSPGGRALWDNVRITGTLDREWIESMMRFEVRLTGKDDYEPDDAWPAARELLAGGTEQVRSFSPEGDVDWVSVAAPEGARRVLVETRDLHLGITTDFAAFASDGKTPLYVRPAETKEPGAGALVVPTGGARLFYLRITEPEGRRGTYRLRASVPGKR